MTPAPLQLGQAPSELALNSAGFTPLAFANALRIEPSSPVYVAGLLRREPRIGAWSTDTTPPLPDTDPWISELFPDPATPVSTTITPSGMSTLTSLRVRALALRAPPPPGPRPPPAPPASPTIPPSGMSTLTSLRLWALALRTSTTPDGVRTDG